METFAIDDDFFWEYPNTRLTDLHDQGKRPEGLRSLGVSDFVVSTIGYDRMLELIAGATALARERQA
jgi:hypothetical protein